MAYVYVPNTATQGHEYFKRYFFPQADKDAIIVDARKPLDAVVDQVIHALGVSAN